MVIGKKTIGNWEKGNWEKGNCEKGNWEKGNWEKGNEKPGFLLYFSLLNKKNRKNRVSHPHTWAINLNSYLSLHDSLIAFQDISLQSIPLCQLPVPNVGYNFWGRWDAGFYSRIWSINSGRKQAGDRSGNVTRFVC